MLVNIFVQPGMRSLMPLAYSLAILPPSFSIAWERCIFARWAPLFGGGSFNVTIGSYPIQRKGLERSYPHSTSLGVVFQSIPRSIISLAILFFKSGEYVIHVDNMEYL